MLVWPSRWHCSARSSSTPQGSSHYSVYKSSKYKDKRKVKTQKDLSLYINIITQISIFN